MKYSMSRDFAIAAFIFFIGSNISVVHATTIVKSYTFTLGNFVNAAGNDPSPKTSIYGEFTVSIDPTGIYRDNSSVVTLDSLTAIERDSGSKIELAPGAIVMLTQFPVGNHFDTFVDGIPIGNLVAPGTNNLVLGFDLSAPRFLICGTDFACDPAGAITGAYTLATLPQDIYIATTGAISAVPLPASMPLMAGALLALSVLGLGQRRFSKIAVRQK